MDAASLVHRAWDSLSQATLANYWLKADILPLLYIAQLHQNSGRYHHNLHLQLFMISALVNRTTLQSLEETASSTVFQQAEQHMLGKLRSLCASY